MGGSLVPGIADADGEDGKTAVEVSGAAVLTSADARPSIADSRVAEPSTVAPPPAGRDPISTLDSEW